MSTLQLYIPPSNKLPDLGVWINRFEIHSQSSDRVYTIAQHKDKRHWGCSCPGWKSHRTCKHLRELGLPSYEQPKEVTTHAG